MEKSLDKNGWWYYPELPEGWVLATIGDFHIDRKLIIGMEYLIKWADQQYFECREVKATLTSKWLMPFIEENRVFIKTPNEIKEVAK